MPQIEQTVASSKKSVGPLLGGLMAVIGLGILAAFLIMSLNRQQQLQAQIAGLRQELAQPPPPTINNQPTTNNQPLPAPSNPSIPPSPLVPAWANSPSRPAQTHPVEKGETLFSIGQKSNLEWTSIVKANGLSDENLIKAGDVLVLPTVDAKAGINQVDFTIDAEKAKNLQTQSAKEAWRLDPVEVAKKEGSGIYGLTVNDAWVLGNKNNDGGQATVRVAHDDKQYEVTLTQPVDKGEAGIWAITVVKPVK